MSTQISHLKLSGMDVAIFETPADVHEAAFQHLNVFMDRLLDRDGHCVLGLATGATPEPVYARLVADYRAGKRSFKDCSSYNLDEYYPMGPLDPNSYRSYMERNLLAQVDFAPNRAHLLDGTVPESFANEHAATFDRWIASEGGIGVQLLGLGRNGHIGFNEPCSLAVEEALALPTRLVELHPVTVADAAKDFGGEAHVPRRALTMGIAPVLAAQYIVVLALGEKKASAVYRSLKGPITAEVPGSLLQTVARKVVWLIDKAAASEIL